MTSYTKNLERKLLAIYAQEDVIDERLKTAHNYERAVLSNELARLQIEGGRIFRELQRVSGCSWLEMPYRS